jgi:hypothetical protein
MEAPFLSAFLAKFAKKKRKYETGLTKFGKKKTYLVNHVPEMRVANFPLNKTRGDADMQRGSNTFEKYEKFFMTNPG